MVLEVLLHLLTETSRLVLDAPYLVAVAIHQIDTRGRRQGLRKGFFERATTMGKAFVNGPPGCRTTTTRATPTSSLDGPRTSACTLGTLEAPAPFTRWRAGRVTR